MKVGQKTFRKIGIIYCNFQLKCGNITSYNLILVYKTKILSLISGIGEKHMGIVDVKSSSVHLYVQRKSPFSLATKVIPFEWELLNEGRAPFSGFLIDEDL